MKRPPNPTIPGTPEERTGTTRILRRAVREITRRFAGLQRDVLAIFDAIRVYGGNDAAMARTLYALTPEELAATSQALQDALDRWLLEGRDPRHSFWYSPYDEEAAQLGSAQSAANLTRLSEGYAATRSLQQIVYSDAYRNRVGMAQVKSFEHWTGLSAGLRSELSQIIGRAVVDGKNPKAVRTEIMERLDVSRSKAAQYSQTDITDTLRQARWAESDYATETLGLNLGLLWTSALIPTTRATHAAKNGKVLTSAQVRDFYGRDGNRYNCHCAQTECLLDTENRPILTDSLKSKMQAELQTWTKSRGKK